MDGFLILFLICVVIFWALAKSGRRRGFKYNPNEAWPFERKKLLTSPEKQLYYRLKEALPDYFIFSQVQLSQLVTVRKGHDFKQWFNRINRMSADFVVTDQAMDVLAVIELDDRSHLKADRIAADQKKDKALTSAGIRVIRWKVSAMPSAVKIREAFNLTENAAAPVDFVDAKIEKIQINAIL